MTRNTKEVLALDAKRILDKIIEKELNIKEVLTVCECICEPENITIGDVMWVKKILSLTDNEAIEIFLS